MLKNIIVMLKGILFGVSNLIPGGSGGTTLVVCGIYEDTLDSVTNLRKNFKRVYLFLLFLILGTIIGVVSGSFLIKKVMLAYIPFITYCIFGGFIIGTLPNLIKPYIKKINLKNIIIFTIAFLFVLALLFIGFKVNKDSLAFGDKLYLKDYILLFICGFIGIFAMIVPGVSGILIFLILGYYSIFLDAINNFYHIETMGQAILIGLPVGLGMIAGIFPASALMKYLLYKFPVGTYFAIFGFVVGSIFCLFISFFHDYEIPNALNWVLGLLSLIIIGIISFFITVLAKKKTNEVKPKEEKIIEETPKENQNI
ncbi:MAG: DUF368 domain-containing protein [Acholeplasmatales bacterium]|nr:DUF368 domain-containing protein [Acholeplasmatales bacterium]